MKNQNIIYVLIIFTALECSTSTKRTPNWKILFDGMSLADWDTHLWPKFEPEIGAET